jgi:hypothetical protein
VRILKCKKNSGLSVNEGEMQNVQALPITMCDEIGNSMRSGMSVNEIAMQSIW